MPEFVNPFSGKVPDRKLTPQELVRAVRLNLAAEEEAVHLYLAEADAADNPLAVKVLTDVANEERVHAGEFQHLIQLLTGDEDKWFGMGAAEVDVNAAAVAGQSGADKSKSSVKEEPTIGSLKQ